MDHADLPIVVAFTGASGAPYGVRLLEVLLAAGRDVHLTLDFEHQARPHHHRPHRTFYLIDDPGGLYRL